MRITEITASFGRTIQAEPYCPINFHASVKAEVPIEHSIEKSYEQLFKIVKTEVGKQELAFRKKQREKDQFPSQANIEKSKDMIPK